MSLANDWKITAGDKILNLSPQQTYLLQEIDQIIGSSRDKRNIQEIMDALREPLKLLIISGLSLEERASNSRITPEGVASLLSVE